MQNLHLLEFLAKDFRCLVHIFQYLEVPVEPALPSIENGAHGTEKLLLKTQSK